MRSSNARIVKIGIVLLGVILLLVAGASAASKEKVIYSFQGGSDGAGPNSGLIADAAGNLYGTTSGGGNTGCSVYASCGTVFELIRGNDGWKHHVLYTFTGGEDGGVPEAGLVFDNAGNLYGTTVLGGDLNHCVGGCGAVFELTPTKSGWTEQVLYSFMGGSDGYEPWYGLVFDKEGNLYGTAIWGGVYGGKGGPCQFGCGTVFELTPQVDGSWTETTIYEFTDGADGGYPSSGLTLDSAGNAYGTTYGGGSTTGSCTHLGGCGVIYKLTPNSGGGWTEAVLYSPGRGGGFGIFPSGGVLLDKASHFYGATSAGGDGFGVVFELYDSQKNGWQQRNLHVSYGNPDGTLPQGRLVMNTNGDLLGVAAYGGTNGVGILFELQRSKSGWREIILHTFGASGDAARPNGGLLIDSNGHLFGAAGGGGTGCNGYGCGTVYEVTP